MEVKKFTNKKKSFLKPKFKQSENISITEQFQNKPFQSNNNEAQITLISVGCLKFSCSFFEFLRLFIAGVGNLRPAGPIRPADTFYPARGLFSKLCIYPTRDLFT